MGYYTDAETLTTRIGFAFFECVAFILAILSIRMMNMLLLFMESAVIVLMERSRHLAKKIKDNYVVFEENGIKIIKYGDRENIYLEWRRIQYVYKWTTGNYTPIYYILAEKPIERKKRDKIVNRMIRNIEDGLVIWINDEDPKSKSVEKIIQEKLSHIEVEEKKPWYQYYNKKKD